MLYMVIERFKDSDPAPIGARFKRQGRMLPDGAIYHASWVDAAGMRCFQLMEAPNAELLDAWMVRWQDLVEFEVIPVLTSADFWSPLKMIG
ncbi:MAG TPA: DUF3303 family protein [Candidatus Acidoferrum sp.]|nr:DUF3303 family protein [Candidatus Acidoferrum sp.]